MLNKDRIRCGERISLDDREAFSLPRWSGCREIVCTEGVIWVTFLGDPEDYLLKKGNRIVTTEGGHAVISGIGKSEFSLVQDEGAPGRTPLQELKRTYAA